MRRKQVDDVMGGEGAWDNVDHTEAQCPVGDCGGDRAYFYMVQIRSADEPMTTFYKVGVLYGLGGGAGEWNEVAFADFFVAGVVHKVWV